MIDLIAITIIILSVYNVIKHQKNKLLFLCFLCILYFNYSICVGEYFVTNIYAPIFQDLRIGTDYYRNGIVIMLLYTLLFTLFFRVQYKQQKDIIELKYKSNNFIFYGLIFILIYSLIYGIDRSAAFSYETKITPLYEYSYIIFLLSILYSNTKLKKTIIVLFAIVFIIQDMIWGGRVTSVQICLLLAVTFFYRFITVKRTIISFFAGVISMTIVGFYRVSYSLDENYFENIFNYLKTNLFVLDTATYAYGASMTFLYSMQFAPFGDRFISFINNVMYILIGSSFNMSDILNKNTITQLSDFSKNFHIHNGGGVFPIFFYFWLGWPGCILSGIGVAKYLSYFSKQKDELGSLIFIALIITVPRWYLYNPITMFRGPLVFLPLVYFFIKIIEHILKK